MIHQAYRIHRVVCSSQLSTTPHQQMRHYVFIPTNWKQIQEDVRQWWWRRRRQQQQQPHDKDASFTSTLFVPVVNRLRASRIETNSSSSVSNSERRTRRRRRFQLWPVTMDEYYEESWFSSTFYRPLTSRDRGGRFVNPWNSFTTNGVHSWSDVVKWRWLRWRHGRQHHHQRKQEEDYQQQKRQSQKSQRQTKEVAEGRLDSSLSVSSLKRGKSIRNAQSVHVDKIHLRWIGHSTCFVHLPLNKNTPCPTDDHYVRRRRQRRRRFREACPSSTRFATILTDPMFSSRASPFRLFGGVERTIPPAYSLHEFVSSLQELGEESSWVKDSIRSHTDDDLCPIDVCLLSHDHYDHLDRTSCYTLRHFVKLWVVPLGLKSWLVRNCDIEDSRIVELQWWEEMQVTIGNHDETIRVVCTPAQHWSTRWPWDRNQRLWCSWVVTNNGVGRPQTKRRRTASAVLSDGHLRQRQRQRQQTEQRFYFAGDTGYPTNGFPLHRQIGDAYGPFDLAAIPIGAYEPRFFMADSHVHPSEAVQIHQDIRAKRSVGIHHGSFPCRMNDWMNRLLYCRRK